MSSELLIKIDQMMNSFNHNQQVIARNLMNNKEFQITEMFVYGKTQIVIRDLNTTEVFLFEPYVKSKCNC